MSDDAELLELLHASLVGEVRGEAFYRFLRDGAVDDDAWRSTLEALRALEERTAATLTDCLVRLGLPMPSLAGCERDGATHAAGVATLSPGQLAAHLEARRPAFVEGYRRIGTLLPPGERWVAEELLEHTRTTESALAR